MSYMPQVGDYVVWERESWTGIMRDEGWVYFVGDVPEEKKGFKTNPRYITIETGVKPKNECVYTSGKPMRHKNTHTLLLCYESNWKDLKYVKNRREDNTSTYKSQEGRYEDIQ